MGAFSIWHWLIVLVVVLVLFGGKGKISALMGDFGKGLKSFKKGMKEDDVVADSSTDDDAKVLKSEASDVKSEDKDKAAS
jgi:sec-independent protein translocase protein TatA